MKTLTRLFIPAFTFGQTIFNGQVINKRTKEKIAFASVGLMKENVGINVDENGNFTFISKSPRLNDTLIF